MMTCSTHSGGPDGVTRTDQAENISTKMMPMTAEQRILAASRRSSLEAAPGFLRTQWAPLLIACYSCPHWAVGANLLFPLLSSRGPSCPRRKHGVWETKETSPLQALWVLWASLRERELPAEFMDPCPIGCTGPCASLPGKAWHGRAARLGRFSVGCTCNYLQVKQLRVPAVFSLILGVGGSWGIYANRGNKMRKIRLSACRVVILFS